LDIKIKINNIHGSQMAAKITGTFELQNKSFRFTAIAFGRIGGQNIGVKLSKATEKEIAKLGYDVERVFTVLQKNLLEGNLELPEGLKRESFVDD
jgi:hypothetical protein